MRSPLNPAQATWLHLLYRRIKGLTECESFDSLVRFSTRHHCNTATLQQRHTKQARPRSLATEGQVSHADRRSSATTAAKARPPRGARVEAPQVSDAWASTTKGRGARWYSYIRATRKGDTVQGESTEAQSSSGTTRQFKRLSRWQRGKGERYKLVQRDESNEVLNRPLLRNPSHRQA